jgi:hypothetical protein
LYQAVIDHRPDAAIAFAFGVMGAKMAAMSRDEAIGTPEAELWDTPEHWPRQIRMLSLDRLGAFGEDPRTGVIYWDGEPLRLRREIQLEGPTFWVAVVATVATVTAAGWPILVHFNVV